MLQTSIFQIHGDSRDVYLGNILVLQTPAGYKKLTLLQDISDSRKKSLKTGCFYLFIDLFGILLLFLSGRWFVRRSLRPLEETYQKQQDFVAAASHELRSPIAVIQMTADAVSSHSAEDTRLLSVIKNECRRGSALIKNLLLLASAEQREWAVRKRKFEIDDLLLSLLELYEPLCLSKNGTLQLRLPEEPLPPVSADPELCRQILTILLDNAIAYSLTRPSRKILLRAEHCHPHTLVFVVDHGPGIPDEEKEFIFDRFYKVHRHYPCKNPGIKAWRAGYRRRRKYFLFADIIKNDRRIKHMPYYKKPTFWIITAAAIICLTVFILFSRNLKEDSSNPAASADDKKHSASFSAAIIEADEHSLLVEPVEGSAELSSSDRISIPIEYMPKSPTPKVRDIISIQYNGEIMESYPAQLGEIYDIRFIETDSGRLHYHNN